MPTKWIGYLATGLILLLTAAFGGLRTAPDNQLDQLELGEPHTSVQATVAVERVALVDLVDGLLSQPSEQNKWLVLVATITNLTDGPLPTTGGGLLGDDGFRENFSIRVSPDVAASDGAGVDGDPGDESGSFELTTDDIVGVLRTDDGTVSPMMQPNVPGRVAFILETGPGPAKAIADGALVTVTIYDLSFGRNSLTNRDELLWGNPVAAAQVQLQPEVYGTVSIGLFDDEVTG